MELTLKELASNLVNTPVKELIDQPIFWVAVIVIGVIIIAKW